MKETGNFLLKTIKVFLKTYEAKSPEAEEIKKDLKKVYEALYYGDSNILVRCNGYITQKYSIPFSKAMKYNLHSITEDELMILGFSYQRLSLQQIASLLKDCLTEEVILTKVSTFFSEVGKEAIVYGIEKIKESQDEKRGERLR